MTTGGEFLHHKITFDENTNDQLTAKEKVGFINQILIPESHVQALLQQNTIKS